MAANQGTTRRGKRSANGSEPAPKPHGQAASDQVRSALTNADARLARIKRKPPHEKANAELAYEEAADLATAFPQQRPSIIAGALHGLPSMVSAFVIIGGFDEAGRYRFASAITDPTSYFGGST